MLLKTTPVLVVLFTLLSATAVRAEGTMSAAPSTPAGKNMIWNGAFDGASLRPWSAMVDSPRFGSSAVTGGELCFKLAEPSPHGVDVVLRQRPIAIAKGHHYQLRLKVHATAPTKVRPRLSKISAPTRSCGARRSTPIRRRRPMRRRTTAPSTTTASSWPSSFTNIGIRGATGRRDDVVLVGKGMNGCD